jgi:cytochrome c peroxidase
MQALADDADYPTLFEASFGTREITPVRIALAIATYERGLTSNQTPWDAWQAGDDAALSRQELRGFAIFVNQGGCSCCHAPPLFGSQLLVNDGFSLSTWDQGRAEVTAQPRDVAAFRAPGLRNVGLREAGGLLHDGLAPGDSLEALVNAYTEAPMVGGNAVLCVRRGFQADADERAALVAFLRHGLTDPRMQHEEPPFDRPTLASEPGSTE